TTTIQAPLANFVMSTMISTIEVTIAPMVFTTRERCIFLRSTGSVVVRRLRFQCRIMPVCEQTNDTNTPMMYSWSSLVGEALNTRISRIANAASNTMPLE